MLPLYIFSGGHRDLTKNGWLECCQLRIDWALCHKLWLTAVERMESRCHVPQYDGWNVSKSEAASSILLALNKELSKHMKKYMFYLLFFTSWMLGKTPAPKPYTVISCTGYKILILKNYITSLTAVCNTGCDRYTGLLLKSLRGPLRPPLLL